MALNGLIGTGVPQDWTTHMVGHELTSLHAIDHARTLTIVLPSVMRELKDSKKKSCFSMHVTYGTLLTLIKMTMPSLRQQSLIPKTSSVTWAYQSA